MVGAGDLLVIYSDGIVEAADAHEQEFGEERLISVIERNWRKPPAEICESILASTESFVGREAPQDDQTLLIVRLEARPDVAKSEHRSSVSLKSQILAG